MRARGWRPVVCRTRRGRRRRGTGRRSRQGEPRADTGAGDGMAGVGAGGRGGGDLGGGLGRRVGGRAAALAAPLIASAQVSADQTTLTLTGLNFAVLERTDGALPRVSLALNPAAGDGVVSDAGDGDAPFSAGGGDLSAAAAAVRRGGRDLLRDGGRRGSAGTTWSGRGRERWRLAIESGVAGNGVSARRASAEPW